MTTTSTHSVPAFPLAGLLVLPGWDDDGQHQFDGLKAALEPEGWICKRADLPDSSWPAVQRQMTSRADALRQALRDYDGLAGGLAGAPVAVLGFSFGAYIGAYLAAARRIRCLVLRSPALYPDQDWLTPKEELDSSDLDRYRRQHHRPSSNGALTACAGFKGHVLLVDSEKDQVIPWPVIASYQAAFQNARSMTLCTLRRADHELTEIAWQTEYRSIVLDWLTAYMAGDKPVGSGGLSATAL